MLYSLGISYQVQVTLKGRGIKLHLLEAGVSKGLHQAT